MSLYYYTDGRERFGPYTFDELKEKGLTRDTLVWKEGLADWVPAVQLNELMPILPVSLEPPSPLAYPAMETAGRPATPPKNWLVESILVTLLCCLPFGIVGIIFATKVDTLWSAGQYDAAEQASRDAGKWVKIGAISGAIVILLYTLFLILGVAGSFLSGSGGSL
jgi:hypothetical protein